MPAGTPARSTPQLDFMRRILARDAQHGNLSMPFLEEDERERLERILNASVEHGITNKVERRAHHFLVLLGHRDSMLRFLTDDEREQLVSLTKLEPPPPPKSKKESKPKQRSMSGGEFFVALGVVLSVAAAAYLTYRDPSTRGSAIWVAVWGVAFGASFIGDTRNRSATSTGSISAAEGFVAAVIWGIAGAAIVLLGGDAVLGMTPGWAAFLGFIGAGVIGRAVLKIEDDDDDWDD